MASAEKPRDSARAETDGSEINHQSLQDDREDTPVLGCQQMTDNICHLQLGVSISYEWVCKEQIDWISSTQAQRRMLSIILQKNDKNKWILPHCVRTVILLHKKVTVHDHDVFHCFEVESTLSFVKPHRGCKQPHNIWSVLHKANILFISLTLSSETNAKESNNIKTCAQSPLSPSLLSSSVHTYWAHKPAGENSLPV